MSDPFMISGLELIYDEDEFELQIVNPRGNKMVCGNSGFMNPDRIRAEKTNETHH